MSNFKYLKFEWSAGISTNISTIKGSNIYEVDYIKRTQSGTGTSSVPKLKFVLNTGRFTGYCHVREGYYVSNTQVYVDSTKLIGGTNPNNPTNYVIPVAIYGIK